MEFKLGADFSDGFATEPLQKNPIAKPKEINQILESQLNFE